MILISNAFSLKMLVDYSYKSIDEGYYEVKTNEFQNHVPIDIIKQIKLCRYIPIISEIKFASPSRNTISSPTLISPEKIAEIMVSNGAISLSVLTQHYFFGGSIDYLKRIRRLVSVPLLMKDIIVSKMQIDSAKLIGADYILLIKSVFDKNLAEHDINTLIEYARKKDLMVLVEVHTLNEFTDVLKNNEHTGLIGINNRNLDTLDIDIENTKKILNEVDKQNNLIVSESGISSKDDIQKLKKIGADAFLIGTSLMESDDMGKKMRTLCGI